MKYVISLLLLLGSMVGIAAAHGPNRYHYRRFDRPRYGFYYAPDGHGFYRHRGYYYGWDHYPRRPHYWGYYGY